MLNEEFTNEFTIGVAIFVELFCSIHMSVFVLQPLAEFINPQKKTSLFCKFFIIRAVILLVGNFITTFIAILDFLAIFFGAFILIPVLKGLKKEHSDEIKEDMFKVNANDKGQKSIKEQLEKFGIFDEELLKKELYNIFVKYKIHYSNQNFDSLIPLCDEKFLEYTKQRMNFVKSKRYKEISENFRLINTKLLEAYSTDKVQKIVALFDVSYTEYLMNETGKVLKGYQYSVVNKIIQVTFTKNISGENIYRKCPNCGAPIMPYDITCDYCSAVVSNNNDWRIGIIEEKGEKTSTNY